jgi:dTDP-4-amino-4,6-dideoxygalactose transaminase
MTEIAALGGAPLFPESSFPAWPIWGPEERDNLLAALDSGLWAGSRATRLWDFAGAFARFTDARIGLPLTNGTATIEAALVACGVGQGDEVIVPGLTFYATASAVLRVNAVPVLVDIDPQTLCVDPAAVEAACTDRTRAVIAVHVAGAMCDLDKLVPVCTARSLPLIEDCAHAHGSTWRGQRAGSFGAFGSFSFQHSKLMTAGEGGVLVSSDQSLADRAWSFANCGRERDGGTYHHVAVASNLRMTEWQGAVLAAQLQRYPEQLAIRAANARALAEALAGIPGLRAQSRDERMDRQAYYCFVAHYDQDQFHGLPRAAFERALAAEGVPLSLAYPSLTDLDVFRTQAFGPTLRDLAGFPRYRDLRLPAAEHAAASTVWIHHRALLGDRAAVLRIADACARIRDRASAIAAS